MTAPVPSCPTFCSSDGLVVGCRLVSGHAGIHYGRGWDGREITWADFGPPSLATGMACTWDRDADGILELRFTPAAGFARDNKEHPMTVEAHDCDCLYCEIGGDHFLDGVTDKLLEINAAIIERVDQARLEIAHFERSTADWKARYERLKIMFDALAGDRRESFDAAVQMEVHRRLAIALESSA